MACKSGDLRFLLRLGLRLGCVRFFVEVLEHRGGDFGTARPVATIPPCMALIFLQVVGIGLHDVAVFQEQEPCLLGWHAADKCFGFAQNLP
jgi:hypothetical protein